MVLDWNSEAWDGSVYRNGRMIYNRPLNVEAVRHELAQKIGTALFNNFNGIEVKIVFAGTDGDTNHRYYVQLPRVLTQSKMDELRAFVKGYIVCAMSY